ncbi:MAG: phosphoserine phosphatase SerB [Rhodovibrionaceae bacterium]|nr:phosphoserine phosphatase SerB [Rhodovibrionaceae bacterium]
MSESAETQSPSPSPGACVATLVAPVATPASLASAAERVAGALDEAGATTGASDWLSRDRAVDVPFAELDAASAEAAAREALAGAPVDLAVQPAAGRRKLLLVADMESTIIEQEMLDELADILKLGEGIADITRRAMAGELDFEQALAERVAMLRDLPASALDEAAERMTFTPGARTLVATMSAHGAYCALVSGGFTHFTAVVKQAGGFHADVANTLKLDRGRILGEVERPILGREAKLQTLQRLTARRALTLCQTAAVGDGANDLDMLQAAGLGVACRGKPKVRETAPFRIDHADLTALLYFQGYRDEEIAEV